MSLRVEVAGFGLCRTSHPYAVFVVCVQQEKFEAWTVYRRYNSFMLLREQLASLHPNMSPIPHYSPDSLSLENLEHGRALLDKWLQSVTSNSYILRMQSMYQFLCLDANMPPPYLEIHWRNSSNGSFDEMDMDDLFEKNIDDNDMRDNEEDIVDDDEAFPDSEEECVEDKNEMAFSQSHRDESHMESVFRMSGSSIQKSSSAEVIKSKKPKQSHGNNRHNGRPPISKRSTANYDDDLNDGLDIQSLSVVEAEFIYNKIDDEKTSSESSAKRTINLDAFKIIKVIGKGNFNIVF